MKRDHLPIQIIVQAKRRNSPTMVDGYAHLPFVEASSASKTLEKANVARG